MKSRLILGAASDLGSLCHLVVPSALKPPPSWMRHWMRHTPRSPSKPHAEQVQLDVAIAPSLCAQPEPGRLGRLWERCVARPLAGKPYPEAEWLHVDEHKHLRFLERHGALFEVTSALHMDKFIHKKTRNAVLRASWSATSRS